MIQRGSRGEGDGKQRGRRGGRGVVMEERGG